MADDGTPSSILICVRNPPRVNSLGFFLSNFEHGRDPFIYSLPALEMQIVVIFMLTHLFHFPLKRLEFPKLVSEIAGWAHPWIYTVGKGRKLSEIFVPWSKPRNSGCILRIWVLAFPIPKWSQNGHSGMIRKIGPKALAIGWFTLRYLPIYQPKPEDDLTQRSRVVRNGIGVLASHSMTSFPVVALLLKDLKILNSEARAIVNVFVL